MNKSYRLIVSGSSYSLSNETDSDPMSDFSPGIWAIPTAKKAIKYAQAILENGNTVTVTCHEDPKHYEKANWFIKELGLKQVPFKVPTAPTSVPVTNGKPSTLAQLKKYVQPEVKLRVKGRFLDGQWTNSRETAVLTVQTNAITLEKAGGKSWLHWGKASEWQFDNDGATNFYIDRDGTYVPSVRIEYV